MSSKVRRIVKAFLRLFQGDKVDGSITVIGGKPIKTIKYVEADTKTRKLLHRQSSKRVTLPWWKRECTHVQITKMEDPATKEFTGIMIKLIDEGDKKCLKN